MAKPFLKWAGGKRQIMEEILRVFDKFGKVNNYYEPFLGGGAVFFNFIDRQKKDTNREITLNDINLNLINCFEVLRDHPSELLAALEKFYKNHSSVLYANSAKELLKNKPINKKKKIQDAARFIYINRTCYNGLYRVNSNNIFNVPLGSPFEFRYDKKNLEAVSELLNKKNVNFLTGGYEAAVASAMPGDLVYFDPPYSQVNKNFVSYSAEGFDFAEQKKLRDLCDRLIEKGVLVIVSNHYDEKLFDIYSAEKYFFYYPVSASRAINSKASNRAKKGIEIIIYGPKSAVRRSSNKKEGLVLNVRNKTREN